MQGTREAREPSRQVGIVKPSQPQRRDQVAQQRRGEALVRLGQDHAARELTVDVDGQLAVASERTHRVATRARAARARVAEKYQRHAAGSPVVAQATPVDARELLVQLADALGPPVRIVGVPSADEQGADALAQEVLDRFREVWQVRARQGDGHLDVSLEEGRMSLAEALQPRLENTERPPTPPILGRRDAVEAELCLDLVLRQEGCARVVEQ